MYTVNRDTEAGPAQAPPSFYPEGSIRMEKQETFDFSALIELCKGHTVYIQTHDFPDPDAIGSAYGLQKLLALYGIPSTLCYDGRIDKLSASKMLQAFRIEMTSREQLAGVMQAEDYIICIDSQKQSGKMVDLVGDEVACIDHHPTFTPVEYAYKDVRITGACASMVAQYFASSEFEPDKDTATALLYGIRMDTLQFSRGVSLLDVDMFRYLFPYCDHEKLTALERNNMEFEDLKAYGEAIDNIEIYGTVGFSHLSFACPDAMVAILSDFILSLMEVDVAVIYSYREDGIKFSVRSEAPLVHAGQLAGNALEGFGSGGGHAAMAGGLIPTDKIPLLGRYPNEQIRERFLAQLSEHGL